MGALLLGILTLVFITMTLGRKELRDYCLKDSFNVTCAPDEVIVIGEARYGRMRPGRCISNEYGNIGCWTDVVGRLDVKCSGRRSCAVSVRDLVDVQPCRRDFMSYLEASYSCVKVPIIKVSNSCPSTKSFRLSTSSGYLPGWTDTESPIGTSACPWLIEAPTGRRVNITLYDLTGRADATLTTGKGRDGECILKVVVEEDKHIQVTDACKAKKRKTVIFTSRTSNLRISVLKGPTGPLQKTDILIHYIVVGCADPQLPVGARMFRKGNDLVVRCNGSKETWYLTCDDDNWVGTLGNCSRRFASSSSVVYSTTAIPHGIILAVFIGIGLGVAIGTTLLCLIKCIHKRRKDGNTRTDTLMLAPTYSVERSSTAGKGSVPSASRSDTEQCFNIHPTSSSEDCCDDGGNSAPRIDQPHWTLSGCATNSAKRKRLFESPLYSHGAHRSSARSAVYFELAANANRAPATGRNQTPTISRVSRNSSE